MTVTFLVFPIFFSMGESSDWLKNLRIENMLPILIIECDTQSALFSQCY